MRPLVSRARGLETHAQQGISVSGMNSRNTKWISLPNRQRVFCFARDLKLGLLT